MAAYLVEVAGRLVGAGADLAGGCGAAPFGKRMILKTGCLRIPERVAGGHALAPSR